MVGDPDYGKFAWFLGPAAENETLARQLLDEVLTDVAKNRRMLAHDVPAFGTVAERSTPSFCAGRDRLFSALRELLARLRSSTPFWSPRYLAHLNGDVHLAAVAGQVATLFYNPNIIVRESSPGVLDLERDVIRQMAHMVGYDPAVAGGTLTSGGTLGNLEQLWRWRNLRYLPLALRECGEVELPSQDDRALLNLSVEDTLNLAARAAARGQLARIGSFGRMGCWGFAQYPGVILAPASAHYSILKVADILGIGRDRVVSLPLDSDLRADPAAASRVLADLRHRRVPVLALVLNLGSTEEGKVDPVHEFLTLREECRWRGQDYPVAVDAAIGGFLCAMLRDRDDTPLTEKDLAERWGEASPAPEVVAACRALARVDGVTVDSHKWQLVPYQAGAVLFRDRRVMLLTPGEDAPYLFRAREDPDFVAPFTVEGSRPGSRAAMVWMAQRVTPLDSEGMGPLLAGSLRNTRKLAAALDAIPPVEAYGQRVRVRTLLEPDLCIVNWLCIPETTPTLAAANALNELVAGRYRYDGSIPVTAVDYIISSTTLDAARYGDALRPILEKLGLDATDYPERTDHLVVLRSTVFHFDDRPTLPVSRHSPSAHRLRGWRRVMDSLAWLIMRLKLYLLRFGSGLRPAAPGPAQIDHHDGTDGVIAEFVDSLRVSLRQWSELAPLVMENAGRFNELQESEAAGVSSTAEVGGT